MTLPYPRIRISSLRCIYCGDRAQEQEHWPPQSFTHRGYILDACGECNRFASDEFPLDFVERALYVKSKLVSRYQKYIDHPVHSDEELAEYGFNLRTIIEKWNQVAKWAISRIAWNAVSYISCIDRSSCFVPMDADNEDTEEISKQKLQESRRNLTRYENLRKRMPAADLIFNNRLITEFGVEEGWKMIRELKRMPNGYKKKERL